MQEGIIQDVVTRAAAGSDTELNTATLCIRPSAPPVTPTSDIVSSPKIAAFEVEMDAVAWLQQCNVICGLAVLARPACRPFTVFLDDRPGHSWLAFKYQQSTGNGYVDLWHWINLEEYMQSLLKRQVSPQNDLTPGEPSATGSACRTSPDVDLDAVIVMSGDSFKFTGSPPDLPCRPTFSATADVTLGDDHKSRMLAKASLNARLPASSKQLGLAWPVESSSHNFKIQKMQDPIRSKEQVKTKGDSDRKALTKTSLRVQRHTTAQVKSRAPRDTEAQMKTRAHKEMLQKMTKVQNKISFYKARLHRVSFTVTDRCTLCMRRNACIDGNLKLLHTTSVLNTVSGLQRAG